MHKFIKLFKGPNAPAVETKQKQHNESFVKRKVNERNKKIKKTKSNSSENLLNVKPLKNNSNSAENLDQTSDVMCNEKFNKDSALSLESVFCDEKSATMDGRSSKPMLKSPSSGSLIIPKTDTSPSKSKEVSQSMIFDSRR